MQPLVNSFSIGTGLTIARLYTGPVFVTSDAIVLVAFRHRTDPSNGGGGVGGQIAIAAVEAQLNANQQAEILQPGISSLPEPIRDAPALRKATPNAQHGFLTKTQVKAISFSIFNGVKLELTNGLVVGLQMMPWSFGKARAQLAQMHWRYH